MGPDLDADFAEISITPRFGMVHKTLNHAKIIHGPNAAILCDKRRPSRLP
jgi:hypothetical protein